jgi:hypothetical protein
MPIGNSVRCLARCESQIKRGAFGIREERAGLIIPECLYLLFVNTLIKCAQRRVRLAILTPSSSLVTAPITRFKPLSMALSP